MLASIYKVLAQWASDLISWFMGCVDSLLNAILSPIITLFPDLSSYMDFAIYYLQIANYFIALDFGFYLLALWFSITTSLIIINWILGLIPTVN